MLPFFACVATMLWFAPPQCLFIAGIVFMFEKHPEMSLFYMNTTLCIYDISACAGRILIQNRSRFTLTPDLLRLSLCVCYIHNTSLVDQPQSIQTILLMCPLCKPHTKPLRRRLPCLPGAYSALSLHTLLLPLAERCSTKNTHTPVWVFLLAPKQPLAVAVDSQHYSINLADVFWSVSRR